VNALFWFKSKLMQVQSDNIDSKKEQLVVSASLVKILFIKLIWNCYYYNASNIRTLYFFRRIETWKEILKEVGSNSVKLHTLKQILYYPTFIQNT
jgi:hypothetical protein